MAIVVNPAIIRGCLKCALPGHRSSSARALQIKGGGLGMPRQVRGVIHQDMGGSSRRFWLKVRLQVSASERPESVAIVEECVRATTMEVVQHSAACAC